MKLVIFLMISIFSLISYASQNASIAVNTFNISQNENIQGFTGAEASFRFTKSKDWEFFTSLNAHNFSDYNLDVPGVGSKYSSIVANPKTESKSLSLGIYKHFNGFFLGSSITKLDSKISFSTTQSGEEDSTDYEFEGSTTDYLTNIIFGVQKDINKKAFLKIYLSNNFTSPKKIEVKDNNYDEKVKVENKAYAYNSQILSLLWGFNF